MTLPSVTESTPATIPTPVVETPPVEPNLNPYGYEVEETPAAPVVETPPVEAVVPPVAETPANPVSGYNGEIPKPVAVETPPVEAVAPPVETPAVEATPEEIKKGIDDALGDYSDKEIISKFAVDNKMTKEQVLAYVALMKSEDAKALTHGETLKQQQAVDWNQELVDDNSFGGDNFTVSIDKVNKLVEKHMPDTNKRLTDTGKMLPPYIMKDLLRLSDALNPTTELVTGDPSTPPVKESVNFLDEMYPQ